MDETTGKSRVISLKPMQAAGTAIQENLTRRLEREGWIRQSTIGEPRLSELVSTYERLGYEVRIEANQEAAAGDSACSTGGASGCSGGATSGCSGGGCSSGASANVPEVPIAMVDDGADLRTLFVRKVVWSSN
jgi:hypothetical protein